MAVQVDFYVVSQDRPSARERTACRLAEKAWYKQHRVFIHTASAEATRSLDELLWTFRQDSFVPHGIYPDNVDPGVSILVGDGTPPSSESDVLINLSDGVPSFHAKFTRIVEVVGFGDDQRRRGRERFRAYRDHGCVPRTHNV